MNRQTPPTLESKIILVQGSIRRQNLWTAVFTDQNGVPASASALIRSRHRVSAVPGDRFLKVEFIPARGGRK